jgi:signal transduction histidine kinase
MNNQKNHIGVMVYGLSAAQYARLNTRLVWMKSFANLAASSIEAWRNLRGREQKLEATLTSRFEQHARKVVHEAGNPLAIINNYLKIVSRKLPEENNVQQELNILREEISRVAQIVRRISDLVENSPASDTFDVNALIEGMLALYGESLFFSCGITLEKTLDPDLTPITGDRDSLKQILFNLWKNGSEAMPAGGCFTISTRGNVMQGAQSYIEIRLTDTGPGLPPDVSQSLFQPLDPNRRPGHSGIGLSIVASLVERLGGQITCQSQIGKGTCFNILLPQPKVVSK